MKSVVEPSHRTLIDELLDEQSRLTAVEKFSRQHENHAIPLQQKYYRDLIPFTSPGFGEQFGFEVNLDACSGCKACVTACHSLNGLDDNETWRKVGTLIGRNNSQPFQQTVTTACHHCIDPGCLNGCPVEAYEKDSVTGIVRHLDDQCIGCQYCSMTCPYEVPQYSEKRGIVRKCDMCSSRLAAGEAPACVQACPNGAIAIRIVPQQRMLSLAQKNVFLVEAPDPKLTVPSTRYLSSKPFPGKIKAASGYLHLEPTHWPLVFMLVLTQMSAGIFLFELIRRMFSWAEQGNMSNVNAIAGFIACGAGLLASVMHLGRPLQAWRSFLGWRHSWLSREILVFGVFAAFSTAAAACSVIGASPLWQELTLFAASVTGVIGVLCSAMVYHATQRDFWSLGFSAPKFFGTTFLLGTGTLFATSVSFAERTSNLSGAGLIVFSLLKLAREISFFQILEQEQPTSLINSARLMRSRLRLVTAARVGFGLVGGVLLPVVVMAGQADRWVAITALLLCLLGELFERFMFFTAVAPPKMPGGN